MYSNFPRTSSLNEIYNTYVSEDPNISTANSSLCNSTDTIRNVVFVPVPAHIYGMYNGLYGYTNPSSIPIFDQDANDKQSPLSKNEMYSSTD